MYTAKAETPTKIKEHLFTYTKHTRSESSHSEHCVYFDILVTCEGHCYHQFSKALHMKRQNCLDKVVVITK